LDVLATLEEMVGRGAAGPSANATAALDSLRFEARVQKDQDVVVLLDASLSMTGEKIALLAVASAVVALCVPSRRLCLVSFASQCRTVKRFDEELSVEDIVRRVLEIPTLGLTNIEIALQEALKILDREARPAANVILVGDGKYTEGKDPSYLAGRFEKLHALKLGRDIAGRALLQDLVRHGGGRLFEVRRMPELPRVMYGALRSLLR
jgi:Mg-chelatase subunit ChlD